MRNLAMTCQRLQNTSAERTALEHPTNSSGNQGGALQSGAKSGALSGDSAPSDADLAAVVAAWPTLPEAVRQQVVATVEAAKRGSSQGVTQ
jgi:hypothetical protein